MMVQSPINNAKQITVLKRLLSYFKPHKSVLLFTLFCVCIFSLVDAGMIYFIKPLIDDGLARADSSVLEIGALLVILIFAVRGIASFGFNYCLAYISSKVTFTIRQQAFNHLQFLPVSYFQQNRSGKLISKFIYDSEQISKATSDAFLICIRESLIVLVLLAIMFYSSWQLSLIFLIVGPMIALVINVVSRRFKKISGELQNSMGEVTRQCEQSISNHKEVLAYSTQELEQDEFKLANNNHRQQTMKLASATAISNPVVQLIASLAIAAVLWLASIDGVIQQLSAGTFTTTLVAMGSLLRPLKQLTNVNQILQRGLVAADSLFQLLAEKKESDQGEVVCAGFNKSLVIKDLNFSYPNQDELVLKNINCQIDKGQTIALVGESGSGKTTLFNLLLRFYPLSNNEVSAMSVDGQSINDLTLESLRQQFSLVSQKIVLFDDSIAANIRYGCRDNVTREEIEAAAKAAHVLDFANVLPNGLDTQIGENGSLLSGGQIQRIAIARAFLRDAPILLLDEATSALDSQSEARIQQALAELQQNKTTLIIAHRLSSIRTADQILVLKKGQIIERGDHEQLMKNKAYYYQLHQQQVHHNEVSL